MTLDHMLRARDRGRDEKGKKKGSKAKEGRKQKEGGRVRWT